MNGWFAMQGAVNSCKTNRDVNGSSRQTNYDQMQGDIDARRCTAICTVRDCKELQDKLQSMQGAVTQTNVYVPSCA